MLTSGAATDQYSSVSCAAGCDLFEDGGIPYHFCDPSAPVCPVMSPMCNASRFLVGYAVCLP